MSAEAWAAIAGLVLTLGLAIGSGLIAWLAAMYREITAVSASVGRIETKVTELEKRYDEKFETGAERMDRHSMRLDDLETEVSLLKHGRHGNFEPRKTWRERKGDGPITPDDDNRGDISSD